MGLEIKTFPVDDVVADAVLTLEGLTPKIRSMWGFLSWQGKLHDPNETIQDRDFIKSFFPFIQEYKTAKVYTPELVDYTWQGIWKNIGEAVGYSYKVPRCDRTPEELQELKVAGRSALLLPTDIYTPGGLMRFAKAFPSMKAFFGVFNEAVYVSYRSDKGGCIDIEMSIDAPFRGRRWGYNRKELWQRIKDDGRIDQRLPTYVMGSQFSELLTGHYFDSSGTSSRLTGSVYRGEELEVWFKSDGQLHYLACHPDVCRLSLGGRSEGRKGSG